MDVEDRVTQEQLPRITTSYKLRLTLIDKE